MALNQPQDHLHDFFKKMEEEGLDPVVIETFGHYYGLVLSGVTGLICENEIKPVDFQELPHADDLAPYAEAGKKALPQAVMIVLNGGLGTSMGLTAAKSLIKAKGNRSFLDIILAQAQRKKLPLCFMNSFNTHQDTLAHVARLKPAIPVQYFLQNRFPKILRESLAPADWPENPHLEWNPPGHGDIYTALYTSKTLERLLAEGFRYAFISNSDNRGGVVEESLLGYVAEKQIPFMMEISQRGSQDMKGGHIARHHDGRLLLREIGQCPPEDLAQFQDVGVHRFFNTNNIWINLERLHEQIQKDGLIRLPMILNPKTLDPRDETSPPVYQVETAMGAAISLFEGAGAVIVGKNRFFPVKTCNDLLVLRSDRILLTPEKKLIQNPDNGTDAVRVKLDPVFFGKIDLFEQRFPAGVPSLANCRSLRVEGDVRFEQGVTIEGSVIIKNKGTRQAFVEAGRVITGDISFP